MTNKCCKIVRSIIFVVIAIFIIGTFDDTIIPVIKASDQEEQHKLIDQDETDKTMYFYVFEKEDVQNHIQQYPQNTVAPRCLYNVTRIDN